MKKFYRETINVGFLGFTYGCSVLVFILSILLLLADLVLTGFNAFDLGPFTIVVYVVYIICSVLQVIFFKNIYHIASNLNNAMDRIDSMYDKLVEQGTIEKPKWEKSKENENWWL